MFIYLYKVGLSTSVQYRKSPNMVMSFGCDQSASCATSDVIPVTTSSAFNVLAPVLIQYRAANKWKDRMKQLQGLRS
jgi:hypothetical protein